MTEDEQGITWRTEGKKNLLQKWSRDSHLSRSERISKARQIIVDRARARIYLRTADMGSGVRMVGRPVVSNKGTIRLGDRTVFRSIVAPVELAVAEGASLSIAPETHVNSGTTICAYESISIGSRVEIATYVTIYDTNFHDLYNRRAMPKPKPVVIEDDVWLCTKCTILPGVRVGRGAVVSANALVRDDVEPFTVVSGVPARVVMRLDPARFVIGAAD
jgi:acetyltransferase-like isoleucine patch superfamily enzyme